MKNPDFPGIQIAADNAAINAQKYYISLLRSNLLVGIFAALLTIYNFEKDEPKQLIYFISLGLLLCSLTLTVLIKFLKYEDLWYQGRALAESSKTLTWRYATCSENFESHLAKYDVQKIFIDSLHTLKDQFPDLVSFMDNESLQKPSITDEMERLRTLAWNERLKIYISKRIDDQIKWYSEKSIFNKKKKKLWLWIILSSQTFSVLACLCLVFSPNSVWNLVGLFTTIAASAIAWLELKQYQSLIQAYTTAEMELNLIKALGTSISTEANFVKYVLDSENAISREHTMWLAQRRK